MAAPLPSGLNISVVPQAPQVDPRLFASDAQGALATAHAGMLLGQELANIENQKAKRALEAEQIKLDVQRNKLARMTLDETARILPTVVGKIVNAELLAKSRLPEEQANLTSQAQFWGQMGSSMPGQAVPAPSGVLAGESVSAPDPSQPFSGPPAPLETSSTDPVSRVMNSPGWQLKAEQIKRDREAALGVEKEKQAFSNEQKSLEEMVAPYLVQNVLVRSGLMREDGQGLDRQKVEKAVSTAASLYPNISRKGDTQWQAEQRRVSENMNKFSAFVDFKKEGLLSEDGIWDVKSSDAALQKFTARFPVQAGVVKQPELEALRAEKRAVEAFKEATAKLDQLGDPTMVDRVLNTMPDPERARGLFENAKNNLAKKFVNPDTVSRMALLNALNAQYQEVLNSTKEGRQLRNYTPLDADQTNKALKDVIGIVTPFLQKKYEDSLQNFPDIVREYLERPRTPRQESAERKAPAFSSPAKQSAPSLGVGTRVGEQKTVEWNGQSFTYRWGSAGGMMGWQLVR